jgi:hypothetical protein
MKTLQSILLIIGMSCLTFVPLVSQAAEQPAPSITSALTNACPQGSTLSDGCSGAQTQGWLPYPYLLTPHTVIAVSVIPGNDYIDGTFNWQSTGGGCLTPAAGTVTVAAGQLGGPSGTQYMIVRRGDGCTHRPIIPVPQDAGSGHGGSLTATVYQATPHNALSRWNMPGVDYKVGYDTTLTLKNPATDPLPEGARYSNHTVNIYQDNVILNGYNFCTAHVNLVVENGVVGALISNNYFCPNSYNKFWTIIMGDSGSASFKYNNFDGLAALGGTGSSFNEAMAILSKGADMTFQYNYCYQQDSKCFQISGSAKPTKLVEQFNLFDTIGNCATPPCDHGDSDYQYGNKGTGVLKILVNFNTYINWFHRSVDDMTAVSAVQADNVTIDGTSYDHNVIFAPGPQDTCNYHNQIHYTSSADIFDGMQETGTLKNISFSDNYLDNSATYFPWYHQGGSKSYPYFEGASYTKNIDAGTSNTCN